MKKYIVFLWSLFLISISCNNQSNSKLSENQINKKVDEIIEMMNIDEKIGQMTQIDQRFHQCSSFQ